MWCSTLGCIVMLMLSLLATPHTTEAQPAGKMPRLGILAPGLPPRGLGRFRQGLRDRGYVEWPTIAHEVRWGEHHPERWPDWRSRGGTSRG
jgi:hypothetical protein